MKPNRLRLSSSIMVVVFALILAVPAAAQETDQSGEGRDWGNYHVNQSIEFGWRGTSITGNNDVYDTFVNLGQGARLYNQTLEMRSLNHQGLLFDNLFLSNFGYGGDPNDVTFLRLSKNQWYDFTGTFRRDRYLWNYDLLANPLNPTTSNPVKLIRYSPHEEALSHRMMDYGLTLMPQSRVRFRIGYSRNVDDGPSLTTYHVGAEALLFQDYKVTTNAYHAGVDFRLLPRTNFSYDQFLDYYKGDTSDKDTNLLYQLANGQLIDMGVSWDTKNNSPCAAPVANSTTTPPTVNPKCAGFTGYTRSGPVRTSYPVEQLSFQSNYFHNADMSGRFVYSSADARVADYNDIFQGYEPRTLATELTDKGRAAINRVTATGDYAVTFDVTPKFRVIDEFDFNYFRIPGQNNISTAALFWTSMLVAPVVYNPATCVAPYTTANCPTHNASSEADFGTTISSLFLGQEEKLNTVQFAYDFTPRFGGHIGYRYRRRDIDERNVEISTSTYEPVLAPTGPCKGQTLNANGGCTISSSLDTSFTLPINEHGLLLGVWARPKDNLRLSYDQELTYADNTFTRVSPRQSQNYRFRGEYRPKTWVSMSSTVNIYEARNNVVQIDHLEHTRNYGYDITFAPGDRWSLDVGYNYTGVFSATNICYVFGFGPPPAGIPPCTIVGSPVPLEGISTYNSKLNFGHADIMFKPVTRMTLRMGYAIDSVTGNTLILNPNSPLGPLDSNYPRPYGSVEYALTKNVAAKAGWGFYDYNEKDMPTDPTGPRSFRGNLVNLSVVYSF